MNENINESEEKQPEYLRNTFAVLLYKQIEAIFKGEKNSEQDYKILPVLVTELCGLLKSEYEMETRELEMGNR